MKVPAFHVRLTIHIPALHLWAISSLIPLAQRLLPAQVPFPSCQDAVSPSAGVMAAACDIRMASVQMANPGETAIVPGSPTRSENWTARTCVLGVQPGCDRQSRCGRVGRSWRFCWAPFGLVTTSRLPDCKVRPDRCRTVSYSAAAQPSGHLCGR